MSDTGTPRSDALFGMFLQDIKEMEKRYPRCFRNKYFHYSHKVNGADRFELVVEPDILPKAIENEIKLSFESRLNRDGKKYVMKTILVATDFSDASENAAKYGVDMADALKGRVILFNAYQQIPVTVVDTVVLVKPQEVKKAVQEQLESEADRVIGEKSVPIEILSKEGPVVEAILDAGRELHADLIVAGMKGSGKALRRMLGSTVTALAGKTTIPLLIIPDGMSYHSPEAIALANDITPDVDVHLLDTLRSLMEIAHPKLYVVRVVRNQSEEVVEVLNASRVLKSMVESFDPVYEYPVDKNVPHALAGFISTHHIDMMAMIPHRRSLLEKWLHPSTTKGVILRAKIPLLILPDIRNKLGK